MVNNQKTINKAMFASLLADDLKTKTKIYDDLDPAALTKEMKHIIDSFWDVVMFEVEQGNAVQFHGRGRFTLRHRKGHTGRNPNTGDPVVIKAYDSFVFEPSRRYRQRLRSKQKH